MFQSLKQMQCDPKESLDAELGRLMRNKSRSFLGGCLGGRLCVHCTLTVNVLYSLYSISDIS